MYRRNRCTTPQVYRRVLLMCDRRQIKAPRPSIFIRAEIGRCIAPGPIEIDRDIGIHAPIDRGRRGCQVKVPRLRIDEGRVVGERWMSAVGYMTRQHELRSPQTMKRLRSPSAGNALEDEGCEHIQISPLYCALSVVS